MEFKGIDISKYQGYTYGGLKGQTRVDFCSLKRLGYNFVMLRAGYGMYHSQMDIAFNSHYIAALRAGLHIGAYHYSYARSVSEALKEADCFLGWIEGRRLEYPVAFDIEDESLKCLGKERLTDIAFAWMEKVQTAGFYTMLYTNPNWASNCLDMDRLAGFDVWLACYTDKQRRNELYTRSLPGIWQYTPNLYLRNVYPGDLDGDIAYKDYAEIIKKAGLNLL